MCLAVKRTPRWYAFQGVSRRGCRVRCFPFPDVLILLESDVYDLKFDADFHLFLIMDVGNQTESYVELFHRLLSSIQRESSLSGSAVL
jgi:hypothetical protein